MSQSSERSPSAKHVDLQTLRETLLYMHDDICAVPDLARIAAAMRSVIGEIEFAQTRAKLPTLGVIRNARFVTRTY